MTGPLFALSAPYSTVDVDDPAYWAAREILETHPALTGLDPHELSSLAQRVATATVAEGWPVCADYDDMQMLDEAYETFAGLLERKKLPAYMRDAIPPWAIERWEMDNGAAG